MLSGIVLSLLKGNKTVEGITKLLCGLFMIYTAVKPLPNLKLSQLSQLTGTYSQQGEQAVQWGQTLTRDGIRDGIKEQVQAYILDKAEKLEAKVEVEVELSDEEIPAPKAISITGKLSPYAKEQLSDMMEQDLGVDRENQRWK